MKWVDLRHAYYLTSADFMAMLAILHVLMLIWTGFGVLRASSDINEIQDNVWALILSTLLFTTSLAGSRRKINNTYGKIHKWFMPLVLFLSLVSMITLSSYHGIITVFALHLVLISFSLTGFPCIVLVLINVVGISFGTAFHAMLVKRLYTKMADDEVANRYPHLFRNYGYGLATKMPIVLIDMGLLFLQVFGGIVFYSRFWKLGLLMSGWKSKPSFYMNDFPFLIKLEKLIYGSTLITDTKEFNGLNKKIVTNPSHSSNLPESPNLNMNNEQTTSDKFDESDRLESNVVTPRGSLDCNKLITVKDYNFLVKDELDDTEWVNFLNSQEQEIFGRRTYSQEKILLNSQVNPLKNIDEYDENLIKFNNTNLFHEDELLKDELNLIHNVQTHEMEPLKSPSNLISSSTLIPTNPMVSNASIVEQIDVEREHNLKKSVESVTFHSKAISSNTFKSNTLSTINSSVLNEKLLNTIVNINNPYLKMIYLIMPAFVKRIIKRLYLHHEKIKIKREKIQGLRWLGPETLPPSDSLQLFSYEPYEIIYVKWMHCFNRSFYNITILEIILIIFYSLIGSILLCYRHYLTLSKDDKELYLNNISRLFIISIRFILFPIISLFIITVIVTIITNSYISKDMRLKLRKRKRKDKKQEEKTEKNKKRKSERVVRIYWIMITLCVIDFIGSLFDVFVSIGLEKPPYPVHNSLVIQFLVTKTAAFLPLRFPILFVLYIMYFVGLFTSQFFFKHTQDLRYITMQVSSQIAIGIGTYCFLIKPIDVNRRRIFSEVVLPYVLFLLSKIKRR